MTQDLHLRRGRHRRLHGREAGAKAEADVSLVARGPHLAAMQANGLTLKQGGRDLHGPPARDATIPPSSGPQDYVIVTLKAHALAGVRRPAAAPARPGHRHRLRAERHALVVLPQASAARYEGTRARKRRSRRRDLGAASGRSARSAASSSRPPRSRRPASSPITMATACRSASPRARSPSAPALLSRLLTSAGFKSPVRPAIRERDLAEALGQPQLQPGQRADQRHARAISPPTPARAGSSAP